jgi:hypothetical protein
MVAVLMIATVAASIVIQNLFYSDEKSMLDLFYSHGNQNLLSEMIVKLGIVGEVALMMLLIGAVPAGIAGWLLLRWLGRLYRAGWISDQLIMTDAVWLMFSVVQSPTVFPQSPTVGSSFSWRPEVTAIIAIGAFVAYKLAAMAGCRLLRTELEDKQGCKLLLLRVFSLGKRSERLFAGFTKLWRYIGSIRMIAGPDLATSTVEPHEFLDFLAGRLQRRFIADRDMLETRVRETDRWRDFDGRFRIAEFFCHDDTWQAVLRRLVKDSDVLLMDLRGFSQSNRGCVFEINELLELMPIRYIVFVVDRTTDKRFLAQVFTDAWASVTQVSPNWNDSAPRVGLYDFDGHVGGGVPALVAAVANVGMHHTMANEVQETVQS